MELVSSDQQTSGGRGTTRVFFLGDVAAGLAATLAGLLAAWLTAVVGMRTKREMLGSEWSPHCLVGVCAQSNDRRR